MNNSNLSITPFVFGLFYRLKRPMQLPQAEKKPPLLWESTVFLVVLVVPDVIYLLFIGVQFAGLPSGETYLAERGIWYAD